MRRPTTLLLAALCALAAASCDDGDSSVLTPADDATPSVGGIRAGNLAVASAPGGITLGNNTTRRVHYHIMERNFATLALWGPCTAPTCPGLAPGERRTIRAADIPGVQAGRREVVVYWFHVVAGRDGALVPDSMRTVVARLGD
jgi:hypothetical protein